MTSQVKDLNPLVRMMKVSPHPWVSLQFRQKVCGATDIIEPKNLVPLTPLGVTL
jgi:hypothetical protein